MLDVCPTSNLRLQAATAEEHPLRELASAGVACSVSTDDPAIFDIDLSAESALAATLGISPPAAYRAALAGALCDGTTRARLAALAPDPTGEAGTASPAEARTGRERHGYLGSAARRRL